MKLKAAFWSILVLLFLIAFFYIQSYDTLVEITFGEYLISTHSVFLCLTILVLFILLLVGIKILLLPFEIFDRVVDKIRGNKEKTLFKNLLQASEYMIIGESAKAEKIAHNLLNNTQNLPIEFENYLRLLFIKLDFGFNIKLHYLQKLVNPPSKFTFFVAKNLSSLALKEHAYHYSLEFALIAFELDNNDMELLELLTEIYASLESWNKMGDIINILDNVHKSKLESMKNKIGDYYLKAAKHFIGLGELENSLFYLKNSLEYNPKSLKCIELISNIHKDSKELNLRSIIEVAFKMNPNFDLFMMYYKNYKDFLLKEEMYDNLVGKIDKNKHLGLAIAIAYFLNMPQELNKFVLPLI